MPAITTKGSPMLDHEEPIQEISLDLRVDGEPKTLDIIIPFDYDGQAILRLLLQDVEDPHVERPASQQGRMTVKLSGTMPEDAFGDWDQRAKDLEEIDMLALELDDAGLTPGEWPGPYGERSGEPETLMLDETIDHDLRNASVAASETKAAFRAMRETSGASQTALAEALGVNVRTVKRWETPGQPEPPRDAWRLVEAWHADAVQGASWHVRQAENLRDDFHEAYILTLYRNQEEFDHVLAPILAQAPSYHWQDALAEARERAVADRGSDAYLEIDHPYTNFPGTRSYWRANAAVRLAAMMMEAQGIVCGFAYPGELDEGWGGTGVWVPRADVQRIEGAAGTIVTCGMR